MEIEEDPPMGIPEWVVTFGDMMSLLLTFFIMLVSLSVLKQEDRYQAMVESFKRQFGHDMSMDSLAPGDARPRTTAFSPLRTEGRAKKKNVAKGGTDAKAPQGEEPSVRIIRQGRQTAIGSVIFFETGSEALTERSKRELKSLAEEFRGKPQKIEIRGHTAPEVAARNVDASLSIQLAFRRADLVRRFLVEQTKLEPYRFRISSAGDYEPMDSSGNVEKMGLNPRVEVFLLDEMAEDGKPTAAGNTDSPNEGEVTEGAQ